MAQILIIDDETLVLSTLKIVLTKAGHTVRTAANGRDGLTMRSTERPDLLITDIVMPGLGGIETIRATHAEDPDLPIIAMSGSDSSENFELLQAARKDGASGVLPKPFTKDQLISTVNRCLKSLPH